MNNLLNLTKEFLIESDVDYAGLWQIDSWVELDLKIKNLKERKVYILNFILEMLKSDYVRVGNLAKGGGFDAWEGTPEELIKQVDKIWDISQSEEPTGFYVWFNITEKGKVELQRLQNIEQAAR